MKAIVLLLLVEISISVCQAPAQGSFVYDQQSSDESRIREGGAALGAQPLGQSFTPSLSAVGFIRLMLHGSPSDTSALYVNLRGDSIEGPILANSETVTLSKASPMFVNFLFPEAVPVLPGTTYYFQPVLQAGSGWLANYSPEYAYGGGMAYWYGLPQSHADLWFRSGIIVPEPGTGAVLGLGLGLLAWVRRPRSS